MKQRAVISSVASKMVILMFTNVCVFIIIKVVSGPEGITPKPRY